MPTKKTAHKKLLSTIHRVVDGALETKSFPQDQTIAGGGAVNSGTGSFAVLSIMAQGTTNVTRVGDSIMPKALRVSYYMTPASTVGGSDTNGRVIIFADKDHNGLNPVLADILSITTASNSCNAGYNPDNVPTRFTILSDHSFPLMNYASVAGVGNPSIFTRHIKRLPGKVNYVGATAGKNTIFALAVSSQAAGNSPKYGFASQLLYKDA